MSKYPKGSIVFVGSVIGGQDKEGYLFPAAAAAMRGFYPEYEVIGMAAARSYLLRCVKTGNIHKAACRRCVALKKGTGPAVCW
jgi:hypothetical protein